MYETIGHGITENSAEGKPPVCFLCVRSEREILPSEEIKQVGKKVILILYKSLIRRKNKLNNF